MQLKVVAFAQVAEQLGFREQLIECSPEDSPATILARLAPELDRGHLRAAVDHEYRSWNGAIGAAQELALIPPVSGG